MFFDKIFFNKKKKEPEEVKLGHFEKLEEKKPKENSSLAESIASLTPDQIELSPAYDPGAALAQKRANYTRTGIMIICVLIFIGSAFSIMKTLAGYRKAEDFYNQLSEVFISLDEQHTLQASIEDTVTNPFGKSITTDTGNTLDSALFDRMETRIKAMQQVNADICGWINIPGTKHINYPLLIGNDNDFYLSHEYTGGKLAAGSIFVSYECNRDFNANHNTVIYGHNMQNGMMFSELISYLKKDFFDQNKYIYIYTEYGVYIYEIYSIFKTDYKYKYIQTQFNSHKDFVSFAYEMKANSIYQREGIEFDENSRIVTLSTCTNGLWSDRYCVQAVMIDFYNH